MVVFPTPIAPVNIKVESEKSILAFKIVAIAADNTIDWTGYEAVKFVCSQAPVDWVIVDQLILLKGELWTKLLEFCEAVGVERATILKLVGWGGAIVNEVDEADVLEIVETMDVVEGRLELEKVLAKLCPVGALEVMSIDVLREDDSFEEEAFLVLEDVDLVDEADLGPTDWLVEQISVLEVLFEMIEIEDEAKAATVDVALSTEAEDAVMVDPVLDGEAVKELLAAEVGNVEL